MKTFYVYYEGRGEGCDYTIGCNLNVEIVKAKNVEEVVKKITDEWDECGFNYVESRYAAVTIIEAPSTTDVDINGYIVEAKAKAAERIRLKEEDKEKAEFERLKKKFG